MMIDPLQYVQPDIGLWVLPEYNVGIFVAANRNRGSGGGRVSIDRPIIKAVLDFLGAQKRKMPHQAPPMDDHDLSEYVGEYYYSCLLYTSDAADD